MLFELGNARAYEQGMDQHRNSDIGSGALQVAASQAAEIARFLEIGKAMFGRLAAATEQSLPSGVFIRARRASISGS